ncbi:MAG TPA: hypothetical protein VH560_11440 [Polyangia bacterium]|jgi:hypothetical protein|nr:hypothetical protein [Polyangia bacterium]
MRSRRADSPPSHPARRDGQSGAIRPAGLAAAIVTAGAVFGLGVLVLPPISPPISPEASPAAVVAPPPAPPPMPVVDAAAVVPDAAKADATTAEVSPPKEPTPTREPAATPKHSAAEAPEAPVALDNDKTKPSADAARAEPSATHEKSADKDIARDAWRKNLPDISPEPGKSSILIPIKGSIDGSTYHVTAKPKSVLISLPKGESMITMPFYNIRHDGFRQLWIKKDDQTGATTIRVVLGEATDPQVEIKDEFVRVTVRRPDEAAPAAATTEPAAAPAAHEPTTPAHD